MQYRWLGLALILLAMPSQGAINGPQLFDADYGYMDGFEGNFTIISGAADVTLDGATGAFGFFDTQGFAVTGLERVCWQHPVPFCQDGDLALQILPGGSIGIELPGVVDASFTSAHSLALFTDFEQGEDLNTYSLAKTLMAPSVGGRLVFEEVQSIPFSGVFNLQDLGGLVGLDNGTTIELREQGQLINSFEGKDAQLSFSGTINITPIESDLVLLPFEAGSRAVFRPASDGAAAEGLQLSRVDQLLADLEGANAGASGPGESNATSDFEDIEDVLAAVLNGAILRLPGNATAVEDEFAMVRFDELRVAARSNDRLTWEGEGPLVVQGGQVVGAPNLVGPGFFAMPLWSIILWVVALGVWIARLVVRPPKEHRVWDRYKWVGWVFGVLAFLVLFFLWDLEVRAVWGTSLLTTDARGVGLAVTAAVQMAPLAYILFVVGMPLRMIFRNGLLLSRQGTFMGLSGGVAYLLSYALGATLLLAYIELIITAVMENIGG